MFIKICPLSFFHFYNGLADQDIAERPAVKGDEGPCVAQAAEGVRCEEDDTEDKNTRKQPPPSGDSDKD